MRRLKGLTQEAFAAKLPGANQAMVTRIEKGRLESIRFDILQALICIAVEQDVPLDWYLTGEGPLEVTVSPNRFDRLRGVDVPPGVRLIADERTNERAVTLTAATETLDDDAMDGIANNQGGGGE